MKRINAFMELSRREESFEFMDGVLLFVWFMYLLIIFYGASWNIFLSIPVFFLQLLNRDYRKDKKSFAYGLSISRKQTTFYNLRYTIMYWIFAFLIISLMELIQYVVYRFEGAKIAVNYFQYWKGTLFFLILSLVILGLNHPLMYIKSKIIWMIWESGILAIVIIIKQFFTWMIPIKFQIVADQAPMLDVGISNSPHWWWYFLILGGIAMLSMIFAYIVSNVLQKSSRLEAIFSKWY